MSADCGAGYRRIDRGYQPQREYFSKRMPAPGVALGSRILAVRDLSADAFQQLGRRSGPSPQPLPAATRVTDGGVPDQVSRSATRWELASSTSISTTGDTTMAWPSTGSHGPPDTEYSPSYTVVSTRRRRPALR